MKDFISYSQSLFTKKVILSLSIILACALIILSPKIGGNILTRWIIKDLIQEIAPDDELSISLDEANIHWFEPQFIQNIKVDNEKGDTIFSSSLISTDLSLWSYLTGSSLINAKTTIEKPYLLIKYPKSNKDSWLANLSRKSFCTFLENI